MHDSPDTMMKHVEEKLLAGCSPGSDDESRRLLALFIDPLGTIAACDVQLSSDERTLLAGFGRARTGFGRRAATRILAGDLPLDAVGLRPHRGSSRNDRSGEEDSP